MFDRLVEIFCEVDDFCQALQPQFEAYMIGDRQAPRGPDPGLADSEIITLLLMLHGSGFKYLKSFYNSPMGEALRRYFPGMPCYERFVTLQKRAFVPLMMFMFSKLGAKTGIYYIDSTPLTGVSYNAFLHIMAAILSYQLNPITPNHSLLSSSTTQIDVCRCDTSIPM